MAKLNFFTTSDLLNLNISNSILNQLNLLSGINNLSIIDVAKIIDELIALIEPFKITNSQGKKEFRNGGIVLKDAFLLSSLLIVKLREFITKEEFVLSTGFEYEDNGVTSFGQTVIPFNTLISSSNVLTTQQSLFTSLEAQAVKLSRDLFSQSSKLTAAGYQDQLGQYNDWERILQLAEKLKHGQKRSQTITFYAKNKKGHFTRRRTYYVKNLPDQKVMIRYARKDLYFYYLNRPNTLLRDEQVYGDYQVWSKYFTFFNRGWLYEWYQDILQDPIAYANMSKKLMGNSLEGLFEGHHQDSVSAFGGGDFNMIGLKGKTAYIQAVQAKYNNQNIFSFSLLYNTLIKLQTIFNNYIIFKKTTKNQLAKELKLIFAEQVNTQKAIGIVNSSIENTIDKMVQNWIKN